MSAALCTTPLAVSWSTLKVWPAGCEAISFLIRMQSHHGICDVQNASVFIQRLELSAACASADSQPEALAET